MPRSGVKHAILKRAKGTTWRIRFHDNASRQRTRSEGLSRVPASAWEATKMPAEVDLVLIRHCANSLTTAIISYKPR